MSQAYEDGREAANKGAWAHHCPHPIGSKEAGDWLKGLHDQLAENRETHSISYQHELH